jgi:hypothetical protein
MHQQEAYVTNDANLELTLDKFGMYLTLLFKLP